jgi:DNA-binding NarL/FixJ family response regulator
MGDAERTPAFLIIRECGVGPAEPRGELEDGELRGGARRAQTLADLGQHPTVIVMDVRMRGMDGVGATRRPRTMPDAPPVLILTTFDDDEVLSSRAAGFVLRDAPAEDLIRATRTMARAAPGLIRR